MKLDDEIVERYSRQIVLAEVGPEGQLRLAASRVAILGDGAAAARAAAYVGAAGVGWIACAPALHGTIDPDRPHLVLATPADATTAALDAVIVTARSVAEAAAEVAIWSPRARAISWVAAGRVGGAPPCPLCGAAATPAAASHVGPLADALLGTIAATETVKALLAIGAPLAGNVLAYDPEAASLTRVAAAARPACACGGAARSA